MEALVAADDGRGDARRDGRLDPPGADLRSPVKVVKVVTTASLRRPRYSKDGFNAQAAVRESIAVFRPKCNRCYYWSRSWMNEDRNKQGSGTDPESTVAGREKSFSQYVTRSLESGKLCSDSRDGLVGLAARSTVCQPARQAARSSGYFSRAAAMLRRNPKMRGETEILPIDREN